MRVPLKVCVLSQELEDPTAQCLLAQLPGLLSFLAAAADSGRSGGPPGCVLVAAAAGHDGDAAVVAIAHVMRVRRLTCYEALLLASRRRAALQLKVRAGLQLQIKLRVRIWDAGSAMQLETSPCLQKSADPRRQEADAVPLPCDTAGFSQLHFHLPHHHGHVSTVRHNLNGSGPA